MEGRILQIFGGIAIASVTAQIQGQLTTVLQMILGAIEEPLLQADPLRDEGCVQFLLQRGIDLDDDPTASAHGHIASPSEVFAVT